MKAADIKTLRNRWRSVSHRCCVGKSPASAVNKKQEKHLHFQRKQAANSKVGSLKVEGIGPQLLSQSKLQVFPRRSINSCYRDFFAFFRMPKTPSVFRCPLLEAKPSRPGRTVDCREGSKAQIDFNRFNKKGIFDSLRYLRRKGLQGCHFKLRCCRCFMGKQIPRHMMTYFTSKQHHQG